MMQLTEKIKITQTNQGCKIQKKKMIQEWHKIDGVSFVFITVSQVNDKNKKNHS